MLGGVAAGIARTYGWDVTLVRLAFVVAALVGVGVPAYVVAWVVIPPDPDDGAEVAPRERGALVGLVLLGIGVLWLGGRIFPSGGDVVRLAWPLALVAGGIAVLVMRSGSGDRDDSSDDDDPGGQHPDAPAPDPAPAAASTPLAPEFGPPAPTVPPTSSAWTQPRPWPAGGIAAPPRPAKPPRPPKSPRTKAPHPSPWLAPLTVSVLVLGAGLAALLDTIGVLDVDIEVAGAIALGVVAATLILSAWYGRALGLVSLAVLLTIVCGVAAIVDTPFKGGVGDRSYLPTSSRELQPEYRLAIGSLRVDLRAVPLPSGTTTVTGSVAIGELHVIVPTDVSVDVHAEVGVGQVDVFGASSSGFSAERNDTVRAAGTRTLRLELRTGAGHVMVERSAS
jgi:phage shock protein PspC (stress-responsive transcriptional regulator)